MQKDSKNKPENAAIGEAIRRARESAGITQAELAERMGVRQQSVGDWERGKTAPVAARLSKLADLLPALRKELNVIPAGCTAHEKQAEAWPFDFDRELLEGLTPGELVALSGRIKGWIIDLHAGGKSTKPIMGRPGKKKTATS